MGIIAVSGDTYEECRERISGVCEGCGGKVEPIETVDNAGSPTFWAGCKKCECFRLGVERKYFEVARQIIEDGFLSDYRVASKYKNDKTDMGKAMYEYQLSEQIARLAKDINFIENRLIEYREGE